MNAMLGRMVASAFVARIDAFKVMTKTIILPAALSKAEYERLTGNGNR